MEQMSPPPGFDDMMSFGFLEALDLEFYDTFFKPGTYLGTHARHLERWHGR